MLVLFRSSPLAAPRRAATSLRFQACLHTSASSIRSAAAKLLRRNAGGIAELFSLPPPTSLATPSASSSTALSFLHSSAIVCGRRSAKIATRKGAQDMKKAKLYGKLGKLILASARQGGADPAANPKLGAALAAAKAAALPREIVDRNLRKAGEKAGAGGADFSEVLYEAYGPGGRTGFIVEALTDNVNRTAAEVKAAVKAGGGKVADGGSVRFGFERAGVVVLDAGGEGGSSKALDEDTVLEAAAEAGADDAAPSGSGRWRVLSAVDQFGAVRDALAAAGFPVAADASGLEWIPKTPVELPAGGGDLEANERLYQKLLELTDVDAVFCSCPGVGADDDEDEE